MKEKITKEAMWTYGKINKFYPPWRKFFWKPAFYFSRWLVNHGLQNPQRITYTMILMAFAGGSLLFSSLLSIRLIGWSLLILSYFLDMCDGKTSRMLDKGYKGLIGYLDNQFHVPITAYVFFVICFRLMLETNNAYYALLGFFLSWIFLWKGEMQFSYEIHMLEVKQPKNLEKYEDEMSRKTYHTLAYDTHGIKKWAYVCVRPFLDATDIWFALLPVIIFGLELWYLLAVLALHTTLLFYKFAKHSYDLKGDQYITEKFNRGKKKKYEYTNMQDKEAARKDLKDIMAVFKKHGMKCWLYGGVHLGIVRDNEFITGDADIDLGYVGKPEDFDEMILELMQNQWFVESYYNHVKILNPRHTSKIDISLMKEVGDYLVEDILKINIIGRWVDSINWVASLYPPDYKYETIIPLKLLRKITFTISRFPKIGATILKISKTIYAKIGYKTYQFKIPKRGVLPLKEIDFKGVQVYTPRTTKIFELLYGKDWKTPTDNYEGRKLKLISNKELSL